MQAEAEYRAMDFTIAEHIASRAPAGWELAVVVIVLLVMIAGQVRHMRWLAAVLTAMAAVAVLVPTMVSHTSMETQRTLSFAQWFDDHGLNEAADELRNRAGTMSRGEVLGCYERLVEKAEEKAID